MHETGMPLVAIIVSSRSTALAAAIDGAAAGGGTDRITGPMYTLQ